MLDQEPFSKASRADFMALFMSETVARAIDVNGFPSIGDIILKFSPDPFTQFPSINSFCARISLLRYLLIMS